MRLCKCGCGGEIPPAKRTNKTQGRIAGKPAKDWLPGHSHRRPLEALYDVEDRGHDTPCWIWRSPLTRNGYGRITRNGVNYQAHRFFYMTVGGGSIGAGLQLDHVCRQRRCVNPDHLEPVSQVENIRRSASAKLAPEDVEAIRAQHRAILAQPLWDGSSRVRAPKGTLPAMCQQWGISRYHLIEILAGKKWAADPWRERERERARRPVTDLDFP